MTFRLILTISLCINYLSFAQQKKILNINRTEFAPVIDGVLDDKVWADAEIATDFIQFRPDVGNVLAEEQKTIVMTAYDDKAVYFAAYLHDDPSKIVKNYSLRDNFGQTDFFSVIINPNNDAQNDTEFFIFPSGTQADAIASPSNGEDFGWDAVWDSSVKIVEDGWIVELKIPYSALRFSNQEVQTWGLQFHRHFRRDRSQYTWNPIDITKGNIGLYHGELRGLENIEPPVRLSLYPYTSGIANSYENNTKTDVNLGLDVKYGITENFTLDATLIPDFSQAGFDDLELNLGPFEQVFSEQRQFFKEGVDLFNKGGLFFSRRIGSAPIGNVDLVENEEIIEYPNQVKTLNAIKVSGRTKNGLGVGIFNAITEKTDAIIRDSLTSETRRQVVEPLANYNIIVFDQQFNKNSSVSLINTNVTRDGGFRDANVTGLLADITNANNTYNVQAEVKMSSLNLTEGTRNGFNTEVEFGKVSGKYRWSIEHQLADKKYDINDFGVLFRNNYNNFDLNGSYRIFEPTETLNQFSVYTWVSVNSLFKPSTYTGNSLGVSVNMQNKKLWNFGGNINGSLGKQYDYFEPRTEGRYFVYENSYNLNTYFSSDYNKTLAFDAEIGIGGLFEKGRDRFTYRFEIGPRVRFNDRFTMAYRYGYRNSKGSRGFVTNYEDDIVFGERDQLTIENSLSGNFAFNSFHALSLTFRNYWATVDYDYNLFNLQQNGMLTTDGGISVDDINDPNVNFNTWNLDFSYSWQFAPGSFLTALYRNQLFRQTSQIGNDYFNNLSSLFDQSIQHTFSIRMVYYIDYNNVRDLLSKNHS
ncbi:Carbohydrate family 9 binding domain-like [Flavobacteriaceae bacterium MAR_2010_188]|nr:Carbohydrate family 9 binding domain-like [Flavobacteriaceae bacterium MAR_2010_188]